MPSTCDRVLEPNLTRACREVVVPVETAHPCGGLVGNATVSTWVRTAIRELGSADDQEALAALVAVAVALPSSALVLRALDPVPELQPDPLFAVPWGDLGAVLAGVVLVTVGGAALVGRTARRDTGGQVLRDAA